VSPATPFPAPLTRRDFVLGGCASLALVASRRAALARAEASPPRPSPDGPNVLWLSIDDLNDWVGCLGGHPDVETPNIDALARRGVLFSHAYCAAPLCAPSRAAVMTGMAPTTSGVYANDSRWKERVPDALTLPQAFHTSGYATAGYGKLFHGPPDDVPEAWDDRTYRSRNPVPWAAPFDPVANQTYDFYAMDWGPIESSRPERPDWLDLDSDVPPAGRIERLVYRLRAFLDRSLWSTMDDGEQVDRAIAWLQRDQPRRFFLACGLFRPHLPWYVPARFFEKYPLESVTLPVIREDDLDDVPEAGREMARPDVHRKLVSLGQWRPAVQAYLASISFADYQIGRLLEALDASPYSSDTLVVLWSDHGWSLGEKLHWRKNSLWEEATRAPLIFSGPDVAKGIACERTVSLLDLYPTLAELCRVPLEPRADGRSLVPLLRNPSTPWDHPAVTTWLPGNHSVRSDRWRFTRYADGSEELYDHETDPNEWTNLAHRPETRPQREALARFIREDPLPPYSVRDPGRTPSPTRDD